MNHSKITVKELATAHPQLTEKALIDFVNGIEVIDDHIRFRETINQNFGSRLWNDLTGQSHLRQQTIDQHVSGSLNAISNWLQFLQHTQIESDLAITKVTKKLAETRSGVMRLNAKHNELAQQVNALMSEFDRLDSQYSTLAEKVRQVDNGRKAMLQLQAVFDKWKAGRLNHYPVMLRLFLVFDELHWGEFGNYCRQYSLEHEIARLIQQAKDKALSQLKEDLQTTLTVWAWQEQLATEIQKLSDDYRQLLAYLTDDAQAETTPMFWAVNRLANGKQDLASCQKLPIVFDADSVIQSFARDFGTRNAQQ